MTDTITRLHDKRAAAWRTACEGDPMQCRNLLRLQGVARDILTAMTDAAVMSQAMHLLTDEPQHLSLPKMPSARRRLT